MNKTVKKDTTTLLIIPEKSIVEKRMIELRFVIPFFKYKKNIIKSVYRKGEELFYWVVLKQESSFEHQLELMEFFEYDFYDEAKHKVKIIDVKEEYLPENLIPIEF